MDRRTLLGAGIFSALTMAFATAGFAASPEIFSTNGVAIHGYDPVAYFDKGKPVEGSPDHSVKWMGAIWQFSSARNRAAFEADPHAYAPQYGGYCAYALSQGAIATSVPEAWTIYEGKLYLNFSLGVRGIWKKDIPGNIAAANAFWPAVLSN